MKTLRSFLFMMVIIFASSAYATTYYVDGTLGADCLGTSTHYDVDSRVCVAGAGVIGWQYVHTANITLVAGDTVYIRGGEKDYQVYNVGQYGGSTTTRGIYPSNSGTAVNPITYSVYPGEKVHFLGQADQNIYTQGILIKDKSYIKVKGEPGNLMKFSKMTRFMYITGDETVEYDDPNFDTLVTGSHYNEIAYCEFTHCGLTAEGWRYTYNASATRRRSTFNHIHHCTFSKQGGFTLTHDGGVLLSVGQEEKYNDDSHYNIVENCHFYHAGHHTLGMDSAQMVVRNNYFHNENWWKDVSRQYSDVYYGPGKHDGLWGYRTAFSSGFYGYQGYNIIEGNRFGHGADNVNPKNTGGTGMTWATSNNIFRYNSLFNNWIYALNLKTYGTAGTRKTNDNRAYNNTFYHNGHHPWPTTIWSAGFRYPVMFDQTCSTGRVTGNVFKNNLFFDNYNVIAGKSAFYGRSDGTGLPCQTLENNWDDWVTKGNPFFINPDVSDPMSLELPDLRLQPNSPVIDRGVHLTTAVGASGETPTTSLTVADSTYFQDGNFGHGSLQWPASVNMQADWIAIGAVDKVVQISSINYDANTITLNAPMSWDKGAYIWLYKKSDGVRVLYGTASDMGAHEFEGRTNINPSPPQNLRLLQKQKFENL